MPELVLVGMRAARTLRLDGRTGRRSVRAEDATIALPGRHQHVAVRADVVVDASVDGHRFDDGVAAFRAGQLALEDEGRAHSGLDQAKRFGLT